jgi:hypothetical protein
MADERHDVFLLDGLKPMHLLRLSKVDKLDAGRHGQHQQHLGWRLGHGGSYDAEGPARRSGWEEQHHNDMEAGARRGQHHNRGCH